MENAIRFEKIPLDLIDAPRVAMRITIDDEDLGELMANMKAQGLIEPVVLRPVGDRYELIAGARRCRAARLLGWELIEAKIIEATDEEVLAMRLAENLQRKDTNPVDDAAYVGEIILRTKKSLEEVARDLKYSIGWVQSRYAVFGMDDITKEYLSQGRISLGAALELSQIKSGKTRLYYTHWAAQNGVSVANARRWRLAANDAEERAQKAPAPNSAQMREQALPRVFVKCAECGSELPQEEAEYVAVHGKCPETKKENTL